MAEYMDYDDSLYDNVDHYGKSKKWRSTLSLILSIAFIVAVVVFVIVRMPDNVRSNFSTVSSAEHIVGKSDGDIKNNEFYRIKCSLENNDSLKMNEDMQKNYPNVYKLLTVDDKEMAKEKVYHFDSDGGLTLAKLYSTKSVKTEKNGKSADESGFIGADIVIIPYSSDDEKATVGAPIRFSLKYYKMMNYVTASFIKTDSFRLNFFSLSVKITSGSGENKTGANITLALNDGLNKKEVESNEFFNKITLVGGKANTKKLMSGSNQGDRALNILYKESEKSLESKVTAKFDDSMYRKFESMSVNADKGDKFIIQVN